MAWRNERSLYKRKNDATGGELISSCAPDAPFTVYDQKSWWSDSWDPLSFGKSYDFSKPFFEQFADLLRKVPLLAVANFNSVNSEYCNFADGNKNCYLNFASGFSENVSYSNKVQACKDSSDLSMGEKNELCYECVSCFECYKTRYSFNCRNCVDSYFLYNCRNCSNCFGCVNLTNKSYYIFNVPYSKEEYEKKIKEFNLASRKNINEINERVKQEAYLRAIHRYANVIGSTNSTGDNIRNSKNCQTCFDIYKAVEDSKFLYNALELKQSYDGIGQYQNELAYECMDNNVGNTMVAAITVYDSTNIFYSINCHGSNNLFGCVGMRSKNYCILNKQYSKEEYEALIPKIIEQINSTPYIDKKGRVYKYGEFFPIELSPYAYNETIAQEYFPFSKNQTEERGYRWRESDGKNYVVTKEGDSLPDTISETSDSVLKEIIGCVHKAQCNEQCTMAFRITPQELDFYRRLDIPLPILCPNCRHYQRLKQRNPLKLWHRKCMCAGAMSEKDIFKNTAQHFHGAEPCPNEFETSYSPDRQEIVYCEQCYQAEVA